MRSSFIAAAVLVDAMKFTRTPLHRRMAGRVTLSLLQLYLRDKGVMCRVRSATLLIISEVLNKYADRHIRVIS